MLNEWAYQRLFTSEHARRAALPAWLHRYNHHRPHTATRRPRTDHQVHQRARAEQLAQLEAVHCHRPSRPSIRSATAFGRRPRRTSAATSATPSSGSLTCTERTIPRDVAPGREGASARRPGRTPRGSSSGPAARAAGRRPAPRPSPEGNERPSRVARAVHRGRSAAARTPPRRAGPARLPGGATTRRRPRGPPEPPGRPVGSTNASASVPWTAPAALAAADDQPPPAAEPPARRRTAVRRPARAGDAGSAGCGAMVITAPRVGAGLLVGWVGGCSGSSLSSWRRAEPLAGEDQVGVGADDVAVGRCQRGHSSATSAASRRDPGGGPRCPRACRPGVRRPRRRRPQRARRGRDQVHAGRPAAAGGPAGRSGVHPRGAGPPGPSRGWQRRCRSPWSRLGTPRDRALRCCGEPAGRAAPARAPPASRRRPALPPRPADEGRCDPLGEPLQWGRAPCRTRRPGPAPVSPSQVSTHPGRRRRCQADLGVERSGARRAYRASDARGRPDQDAAGGEVAGQHDGAGHDRRHPPSLLPHDPPLGVLIMVCLCLPL